MVQKYLKDNGMTIFVLLLSILLLFLIPAQIRELPNSSSAISPRGFPYFCAGALGVCSLALLVTNLIVAVRKARLEEKGDAGEPPAIGNGWRGYLRVAILMASLSIWYLLLFRLGFIICTTALLLVAMLLLGQRKWPALVITPLVFSFGVYFIFKNLLYVALPSLFL